MDSMMADLKFMVSQYALRVETEQQRSEDARAKVEAVLSRVGVVQNVAAGKTSNPNVNPNAHINKADKMFQRLQKIDIETGLEPLESVPTYFSPPDPVVADMVRLAEGQIETLIKVKSEMEAKNTDLENEILITREQLAKREREIQRLGAQLEVARAQQFGAAQHLRAANATNGTRSPSKQDPLSDQLKASSRTAGIVDLHTAKDRIEQLEIQIEYLQEHIDGLEKELAVFERERDTIQSAFVNDRDNLAAELRNERERTAGLLQNLAKLEAMHLKQIADLTAKVKDLQQKHDQTTRRMNNVITEKQSKKPRFPMLYSTMMF
eukprot:jgi/Hompol1/4445/HPOL_000207-RA